MKSRLHKCAIGLSGLGLALSLSLPAQAADKELLDILLQNGSITKEQYKQLSKRDTAKAVADKAQEMDDLKTAINDNVPTWVNGMKWNGDFRVRHDWQGFDKKDATLKSDRNRERFRARFGFTFDVNPSTQVGVQMASGENDPVSTNQTMTGGFSQKALWLDQAYVKHNFFDKQLTVIGGKFVSPFKSASSIIFDPDLRFEGVAGQYEFTNGAFVNGGVFPLNELKSKQADPFLIGLQAGYKHERGDDYPWTAAVGYYDFGDLTNAAEAVTSSNPTPTHIFGAGIAGNTESKFKVINPNFTLGIRSLPVYAALYGDVVHNTAAQQDGNGWLLGTRFGKEKIKDLMDWQGFVQYSRLEANASLSNFAESDFHSGGTNNKGWIAGYKLGLGKGWQHDLTYYQSSEIKDQLKMHDSEKRVQIDMNYKF